MADNTGADKTEEATPRRLREQREKGQVPRSRELGSFAVMGASVLAMIMTGPASVSLVRDDLRAALRFDAQTLRDLDDLPGFLGEMLFNGLLWMLPLLIAGVIGAVIGSLLIGGWNFSSKALAPDFGRLNPLSGLKRMVSLQALMELLKGLAKFGLLGLMLAGFLYLMRDDILALGRVIWPSALGGGGGMILATLALLTLGLLLIALIDAPFQNFHYLKEARMTKQEVKDEYKESEGRPEIKQKIRAQQQALAQRRIRQVVPEASVIVTNPRHFAVALKYDIENMDAPVLLAKGTGPEAAMIRELADEHAIPVVAAPPLARALYRHVRENQAVPGPLYKAVAQVLSYVYQLRDPQRERPLPPEPEIPDDWQWTPPAEEDDDAPAN